MATRRARKTVQPRQRHTDVFRIASGALGPVPACTLEVRPMTVFIGRQGTGKSLIAQMLYFFEELPFLLAFAEGAIPKASKWTQVEIVHWLLDQLRSPERPFKTFANPHFWIEWVRSEEGAALSLGLSKKFKTLYSDAPTLDLIESLRKAARDRRAPHLSHNALFIPTERLVFSQFQSGLGEKLLRLPLTYTLFGDVIERASAVASQWRGGRPESRAARRIAEIGGEALGGRVEKRGEQWRWQFSKARKNEHFDIDMASSGQRANWALPYLAQALFDLRENGDVAQASTVFVEEPEIHLHPAAQVAMIEILALLVNQGFRVVVTTHSLNVIYALNNFMQASRLGPEVKGKGIPEPDVRLKPEDVSVYAFSHKAPRQLVDVENAFIDERELGWVAEEMAAGLNRIGALAARRGKPS